MTTGYIPLSLFLVSERALARLVQLVHQKWRTGYTPILSYFWACSGMTRPSDCQQWHFNYSGRVFARPVHPIASNGVSAIFTTLLPRQEVKRPEGHRKLSSLTVKRLDKKAVGSLPGPKRPRHEARNVPPLVKALEQTRSTA